MKAKAVTPSTERLRQPTMERIAIGNPSELRSARIIGKPNSAPPLHITPRQHEVLALLCEGLPNKLISRRLSIAAATVKVHIGCILRELRVSSRLQAVVAARRLGLVGETDHATPQQGAPVDQSRMLQILWDAMSSRGLMSAVAPRMAGVLG